MPLPLAGVFAGVGASLPVAGVFAGGGASLPVAGVFAGGGAALAEWIARKPRRRYAGGTPRLLLHAPCRSGCRFPAQPAKSARSARSGGESPRGLTTCSRYARTSRHRRSGRCAGGRAAARRGVIRAAPGCGLGQERNRAPCARRKTAQGSPGRVCRRPYRTKPRGCVDGGRTRLWWWRCRQPPKRRSSLGFALGALGTSSRLGAPHWRQGQAPRNPHPPLRNPERR